MDDELSRVGRQKPLRTTILDEEGDEPSHRFEGTESKATHHEPKKRKVETERPQSSVNRGLENTLPYVGEARIKLTLAHGSGAGR